VKFSKRDYIFLAVIAAAVLSAYSLRWLCDDVFITLRYSQNWLAGNGIVYNIGERVEGYTHPLWLGLITLGSWLGGKPETLVLYMGLASLGAVLWFSGKLNIFAAILLAINYDFRVWATGGLETMFFSMLLVVGVWSLWREKFLLAGIAMSLAVLTRPDGIIFAAVGLAYIFYNDRFELWHYLPPFMLVVIHLLWRYSYYGDLLPMSYYAKSGGGVYFSQGFEYLWTWFGTYPLSLIFLLALPLLRRNKFLSFLFASITFYLILFVARVGGDFMFARFVIPVLPMMYLCGALSIQALWPNSKTSILIVLCVLSIRESSVRDEILTAKRDGWVVEGRIMDEHYFWVSSDKLESSRSLGLIVKDYFEGEKVRVLLRGGQDAFGYYAQFDYCMEAAGLTDAHIAKSELSQRGQPGHEHAATLDYIKEKGIHFVFFRRAYDRANAQIFLNFGSGYGHGEIITRDDSMLARLTRKWGNAVLIGEKE
jgi:hypothetical protein